MSYIGWGALAGTELWNIERTTTYVRTNLPTLNLRGCDSCEDLAQSLGEDIYRDPGTDFAPWVQEGDTDTLDFYGFYPLSITGRDDTVRSATINEFLGDGGVASQSRLHTREFRVSGLLIAKTQIALEKGRAWMKQATAGSECDDDMGCSGDDHCYYAACPVIPNVLVRVNYARNPMVESERNPETGTITFVTWRTNWCANPSFETATTGWTAAAGTTLTRVAKTSTEIAATPMPYGKWYGRISVTGALAAGATMLTTDATATYSPASVAGDRWSVRMLAKAGGFTNRRANVIVEAMSAVAGSGTVLGTLGTGSVTFPDDGSWIESTFTAAATTAPVGTLSVRVRISANVAWAAGQFLLIDGLLLEKIGTPGAYFDGSSLYPPGNVLGYSATGLSNNIVGMPLDYENFYSGPVGASTSVLGSRVPATFITTANLFWHSIYQPDYPYTNVLNSHIAGVDLPTYAARATLTTGLTANALLGYAQYARQTGVVGKRFGYAFWVKSRTIGGAIINAQMTYFDSTGTVLGTDGLTATANVPAGTLDATPGDQWTLVSGVAGNAAPVGTDRIGIAIRASKLDGTGLANGSELDFTHFIIEAVTYAGDGAGPFFYYDSTPTSEYEYLTDQSTEIGPEHSFDGDNSLARSVVADRYSRTMRDVALTQGVTVIDQMRVRSCDAFMERVEFTFVAGTPFSYSDPIDIAWISESGDEATFYGASIDLTAPMLPDCPPPQQLPPVFDPQSGGPMVPPRPPIPLSGNAGIQYQEGFTVYIPAMASGEGYDGVPIATFKNGAVDLRNTRIRFYPNVISRTIADLEPCAYCGEFIISYIPAFTTLVLDGQNQTAYFIDDSGNRRSAMHLLSGSGGGPFQWPLLTCNIPYAMTVESPLQRAIFLNPDPDFDVGLSQWTGVYPGAPTTTLAAPIIAPVVNNSAMRITWPTQTVATARPRASLYINGLNPGMTYQFHADLYIPAGMPGIKIGFQDQSLLSQSSTVTGTLTSVEINFVATTRDVTAAIFPNTFPFAGNTAYVTRFLVLGTTFNLGLMVDEFNLAISWRE